MDRIPALLKQPIDFSKPVCLFDGAHQIYWVGSREDSPFRCNAYLIINGDAHILLDPGSKAFHFEQVKERVATVCAPDSITHIIVHHQDPDLCDSLPDWFELNPKAILITTPRCRILLPYYGLSPDIQWLDVSPQDSTFLELQHGGLAFLTSPFLHFPEAMVTYDEVSGFLFSSDIGAAIESDWKLIIDDWEQHWKAMVPFHVFYMASNRALRGFIEKVEPFPIKAILPQHGSVIPGPFVRPALKALKELPCGIDLLYPASNLEAAIQGLAR